MSNILTNFSILFSSNAKEAKKDIDDLNKSVKKLADSAKGVDNLTGSLNKLSDATKNLTSTIEEKNRHNKVSIEQNKKLIAQEVGLKDNVNASNKALTNKNSKLRNVVLTLKNIAFSFLAISALSKEFTGTFRESRELMNFSRSLNMNARDMDAWIGVMRHAGGTAKEMMSQMEMLNDILLQLPYKGNEGFSQALSLMHISARGLHGMKTAPDIIREMTKHYDTLNDSQKNQVRAFLRQAGLSDNMINIIRGGSANLESSYKKQYGLSGQTDEHLKKIKILNDQFIDIGRKVDQIADKIYDKMIFPFMHGGASIFQGLLDNYKKHPVGTSLIGGAAGVAGIALTLKTLSTVVSWLSKIITSPISKVVAPVAEVAGGLVGKKAAKSAAGEIASIGMGTILRRIAISEAQKMGAKALGSSAGLVVPYVGEAIGAGIAAWGAYDFIKTAYELYQESKSSSTSDKSTGTMPQFSEKNIDVPPTSSILGAYPRVGEKNIKIGTLNVKVESPLIDASGLSADQAKLIFSDDLSEHIKTSVYKLQDGRML